MTSNRFVPKRSFRVESECFPGSSSAKGISRFEPIWIRSIGSLDRQISMTGCCSMSSSPIPRAPVSGGDSACPERRIASCGSIKTSGDGTPQPPAFELHHRSSDSGCSTWNDTGGSTSPGISTGAADNSLKTDECYPTHLCRHLRFAATQPPSTFWGRAQSNRDALSHGLVLLHTIIAGDPPEEWMAGFVAEASRMPIHSAVSASPPFHSSPRLTLNFSVKEH